MKLTLARIAEFVSAMGEFAPEEIVQGYSIDSRTVGPGQLFFAVKGERLDGHDFVEQALEKGASRGGCASRINWAAIQRKRDCWQWKTRWLRCRLWPQRCGSFGASR